MKNGDCICVCVCGLCVVYYMDGLSEPVTSVVAEVVGCYKLVCNLFIVCMCVCVGGCVCVLCNPH